jgi:hypothetical protein
MGQVQRQPAPGCHAHRGVMLQERMGRRRRTRRRRRRRRRARWAA